ncbi:MAG: OmpH family outer membrane protein [Verrucomicrobiota bacterium]
MKRLFGKTLLTATVCSLLVCAAQAETKIGQIDLRKVFDNYYKTKQADSNLKDEAADLEKQRREMVDDFKKSEDEWRKLLDKSNDQAIAAAEREKSKQAAEKKLIELKDLETTVAQFERGSRAKLGEKQRRKRDAILKEIQDVIAAKAKAAGYTMVVDVAAASINDTPVVLYNSGDNDLTESILVQLNAGAPPLSKVTEDKKEAPVEKK